MNDFFLIALGSNMSSEIGSSEATLRAALKRLDESGARVAKASRMYLTPCFPPGAGPDYVNAAARLSFAGTPQALLAVLHEIEAEFGRERAERWGRRTLDLDLIAAGDAVLPDAETFEAWCNLSPAQRIETEPKELILPHPWLAERAFVLVPLAEVAPDWVHPVLGLCVTEMRDALPKAEIAAVRPL